MDCNSPIKVSDINGEGQCRNTELFISSFNDRPMKVIIYVF